MGLGEFRNSRYEAISIGNAVPSIVGESTQSFPQGVHYISVPQSPLQGVQFYGQDGTQGGGINIDDNDASRGDHLEDEKDGGGTSGSNDEEIGEGGRCAKYVLRKFEVEVDEMTESEAKDQDRFWKRLEAAIAIEANAICRGNDQKCAAPTKCLLVATSISYMNGGHAKDKKFTNLWHITISFTCACGRTAEQLIKDAAAEKAKADAAAAKAADRERMLEDYPRKPGLPPDKGPIPVSPREAPKGPEGYPPGVPPKKTTTGQVQQ